jgi:hypothetical protein
MLILSKYAYNIHATCHFSIEKLKNKNKNLNFIFKMKMDFYGVVCKPPPEVAEATYSVATHHPLSPEVAFKSPIYSFRGGQKATPRP